MSKTIEEILLNQKKLYQIAKNAFDTVDTDFSGTIDVKELRKVMTQLSYEIGSSPPSLKEVQDVFNFLDRDNNGMIDFEEFLVLIRDLLEEIIVSDY